jgi:hypothetical protein
MDDRVTTATLDQADEEILTYTVSDEALEAAAGTERGVTPGGTMAGDQCHTVSNCWLTSVDLPAAADLPGNDLLPPGPRRQA